MGEHAGKHPRHRYAYQVGATLLGLVLLATSVARAQNAGVESELRSLTERYLAAAQSEDMAAFEQTLDPEAPEYGARLRFQQDLAAKYDIRYDLLDFKLVASDDDFVYAHVSTTMRLWARQDAPAHPSDRLEVYHRSGGTWKIWSEVFLTTNEPWPGNAPTSQLDQLATHVLTARSLEALQDEDLSAYEQTLHPDGALAQGDLGDPEAVQARFDNYDLDYALLDFRAIASEGPFMVARVKQETRTHVGRAYPDNILDLLTVFRRQGTEWKLWDQSVLGVDMYFPSFDPSPPPPDEYRSKVERLFKDLQLEPVDCVRVPDLPARGVRTLRYCASNEALEVPLPEDPWTPSMIAIFGHRPVHGWQEAEAGHIQEFTLDQHHYTLTYRDDGYTVVDISSRP